MALTQVGIWSQSYASPTPLGYTGSYTAGAGSNRRMFFFTNMSFNNNTPQISGSTTLNNVPMTSIFEVIHNPTASAATWVSINAWYVDNASTGQINWGGDNTSAETVYGWIEYSGVDTSSPPTFSYTSSWNSTPTTTISSTATADDIVLQNFASNQLDPRTTWVFGGGQTELWRVGTPSPDGGNVGSAFSTEPGAASVTGTNTFNGVGRSWVAGAIVVKSGTSTPVTSGSINWTMALHTHTANTPTMFYIGLSDPVPTGDVMIIWIGEEAWG